MRRVAAVSIIDVILAYVCSDKWTTLGSTRLHAAADRQSDALSLRFNQRGTGSHSVGYMSSLTKYTQETMERIEKRLDPTEH